jgi:hypothetical protein
MAVDDWRVGEVWRQVHGKLAFASGGSRGESMILWRRIAGGLTAGQQGELLAPWMSMLTGKAAMAHPSESAELWRMTGSLERLSPAAKVAIVQGALSQLTAKRSAPYRDAILWAIGRLASRRLVYGPASAVVPAERAEEFIGSLIRDSDASSACQLAVMQIARRTGDRYLDIGDEARRNVVRWLGDAGALARYREAVLTGGDLVDEDAAAIFGEELPLGIRLSIG